MLIKELYYESNYRSSGAPVTIDFLGDSVMAQDIETLFKSSWDYTESNYNTSHILGFYKKLQEKTLTVSVMAKDAEEYDRIMDRMHSAFEYDVRNVSPGKLWCNGFYLPCYITETEYEDFEEFFEAVDKKLTISTERANWIKETKKEFFNGEQSEAQEDFLDFEYDFEYDFSADRQNRGSAENKSVFPAEWELVINGPATNPQIQIGETFIQVNTVIGDREYLEIDSQKKTIVLTNVAGEKINKFGYRGTDGYVFRKIDPGINTVTWNGKFTWTLTILEERSEPRWKKE